MQLYFYYDWLILKINYPNLRVCACIEDFFTFSFVMQLHSHEKCSWVFSKTKVGVQHSLKNLCRFWFHNIACTAEIIYEMFQNLIVNMKF